MLILAESGRRIPVFKVVPQSPLPTARRRQARDGVRVYGARPYCANARAASPALPVGYGGVSEHQIVLGVEAIARIDALASSVARQH